MPKRPKIRKIRYATSAVIFLAVAAFHLSGTLRFVDDKLLEAQFAVFGRDATAVGGSVGGGDPGGGHVARTDWRQDTARGANPGRGTMGRGEAATASPTTIWSAPSMGRVQNAARAGGSPARAA